MVNNSPNQNWNIFLDYSSNELTNLAVRYDNFVILGDFNLTTENKNFDLFMNVFNLESLTKTLTSFKSNIFSCIDLIISNK